MSNRDIAETFEKVADMLAIRGDNLNRILAYRNGAESIRALGRDLSAIRAEGGLTAIPGIGKTLAEKIEEMLDTGRLGFYDRLAQEIPPTLLDLLHIEGVGPKKVKLFYDQLQITTLEELKAAAQAGKLRSLSGMGAKSEAKILAGIETLARLQTDRTPLGEAWPIAQTILAELARLPGVTQHAVGGSLRRMRETIGDIDLLVAAADAAPIMNYFVQMPQVASVVGHGPTKSRVVLQNGMGVDLRVLPASHWGTLLSYFTGSKAHNVRLRELAQKQGLSLNEYAFTYPDGREIICATEEEVYQVLGLPYISPVLREDRGEIEAAQQGTLPSLIQAGDIVADLHMHTTWSDGRLSVLEMAQAAKAQGLQYIVITDHSASLGIANGLSVERLWQQAAEVRAAAAALGPDFRVFHGTEMEIRADGALDYPDEVLAQLDFVIAALHVSLRQPREQVTGRVLAAINNPHVDMLAHPSGRLLPDRLGADLDMDQVLLAAARTGTIVEINANPRRLDLQDSYVRRALELGAPLAINTDAHHSDDFGLRHYGIAVAQRGWATATNIVNAWPVERFLQLIRRSD